MENKSHKFFLPFPEKNLSAINIKAPAPRVNKSVLKRLSYPPKKSIRPSKSKNFPFSKDHKRYKRQSPKSINKTSKNLNEPFLSNMSQSKNIKNGSITRISHPPVCGKNQMEKLTARIKMARAVHTAFMRIKAFGIFPYTLNIKTVAIQIKHKKSVIMAGSVKDEKIKLQDKKAFSNIAHRKNIIKPSLYIIDKVFFICITSRLK